MAILTVGSNEEYATLTAAVAASHNGDTIEVNAGTYVNDFPETITDNITIEGVGGMATLEATEPVPNGKAILVTHANVTIDNLAFTGASVADENGAGIRYVSGNLVLNDDYFYNNQEGLLAGTPTTGAGTGSITINNTEFSHNGGDDGYAHNIYVGTIGTLTIDNSLFTGAVEGHEIKSEAQYTTIENTRIIDGPTGTASYSIDLPDGGNAVIENDVIEQGPDSQNPAIIHVGAGPTPWADTSVTIEHNTILNDLHQGDARLLLNNTTVPVTITDNEIYGLTASQIATGPGTQSGNTFLATEPTLDMTPPYDSSSGSSGSSGSANPEVAQILAELGPLPNPDAPSWTVTVDTHENTAVGGTGPDAIVIGTVDGDTLHAGTGFSILVAEAGPEALKGGAGVTDFIGGPGTDYFDAGTGANHIMIGSGHDTINVAGGSSGNVDVYDFDPKLDHIDLTGSSATAASLVAGATNDAQGDAVIHAGQESITLHGIAAAHVSADWFTITH
jgi:hypothetical protein